MAVAAPTAERAPALPPGSKEAFMLLMAGTVVFAVVAFVYVQKRRGRKKAAA